VTSHTDLSTHIISPYTAMAAADVQPPPAEAAPPALPDYLTNPDAVLGDKDAKWRYGRAPDYSKTRKMFAESE
jgi:hypothetical protein